MTDDLVSLARSHGIETRYTSETGDDRSLSETALRSLLTVMGIDPDSAQPGHFESARHVPELACVAPQGDPAWGVTCQLYALRSSRTFGLGDFEDLGRLAEIAGRAGAAFLGVNPLHALFFANPGHYSPYSPSTRRFLNPFYIAMDALPGGAAAMAELAAEDPALFDGLDGDLIDYPRAGRARAAVLRRIFDRGEAVDQPALSAFRERHADAIENFALFEALSMHFAAAGGSAGWHGWPEPFRHPEHDAVRAFAAEHASDILFHIWLQQTAETQLRNVQKRALDAGMSIGLYLDFAVGVSPDGAETWADSDVTMPDARVGSPPDMFNAAGQDWGLAPLSPEALAKRNYTPLAQAYDALMKNAGAVRIDHVMGLARLWWIARGHDARDGGYVRYPLGDMVDVVARASRANGCIVIGEDLGTVPAGFRPVMQAANILSYRVLYFEKREWEGFIAPAQYPAGSLACISTHDLATLAGWWAASDIALRAEAGRQDAESTRRDRAERDNDRHALLHALRLDGLLPDDFAGPLDNRSALPDALPLELALAIHRFAARTRSHLFAVQLDDMVMALRQPNLPGTTDAYPNWRIRGEVPLEALEDHPIFKAMAAAMREERPRHT
ncbi:4-alpha-glucanotransferase [Aureimonas altamirensis]|uniref:4-alpha-glucanotransferase n=1 Tax=Aureimonas altamirensis TaxID=370622 RepID=UPI0025549CC9|nr:4-alpha-glucanotransferase [Aureimonas altamirensis]